MVTMTFSYILLITMTICYILGYISGIYTVVQHFDLPMQWDRTIVS